MSQQNVDGEASPDGGGKAMRLMHEGSRRAVVGVVELGAEDEDNDDEGASNAALNLSLIHI